MNRVNINRYGYSPVSYTHLDVYKRQALESALSHIEKQYGKGSVMKLGESGAHMQVETIPTGSLGLDIALGVGGVPKMCIRDRGVAYPRIYTDDAVILFEDENQRRYMSTVHYNLKKLTDCLLYTSRCV